MKAFKRWDGNNIQTDQLKLYCTDPSSFFKGSHLSSLLWCWSLTFKMEVASQWVLFKRDRKSIPTKPLFLTFCFSKIFTFILVKVSSQSVHCAASFASEDSFLKVPSLLLCCSMVGHAAGDWFLIAQHVPWSGSQWFFKGLSKMEERTSHPIFIQGIWFLTSVLAITY